MNESQSTQQKASPKRLNLHLSSKNVEKLTRDTAKRTRYVLFVLFGVVLIGYIMWQLYQIVIPPKLVIEYPPAGLITDESKLIIKGYIDPDSQLTINREIVLPDTAGLFTKTVYLQEGINSFTIEATKRYGPHTEIARFIKYEPREEVKGAQIIFNE